MRRCKEKRWPGSAGLGLWDPSGPPVMEAVPLRAVLGRQTGMYQLANELSDDAALALVGNVCGAKSGCLKRVLWELSPGQAVSSLPPDELNALPQNNAEMPLLCVEACNWLVAKARQASAAELE